MNFVDIIIVLALIYYVYDGYRRGFLIILMELLVFVVSILIAFPLSGVVGGVLVSKFHLPTNMGPAFGFIMTWFVVQLTLSILKNYFNFLIAERWKMNVNNRIAGMITSFVRGGIFISLLVIFIIVMPVPGGLKSWVTSSAIGNSMVDRGGYFDSLIKRAFGGSAQDMVTFFTVNPFSKEQKNRELNQNEEVSLGYRTTDVRIDYDSESKMFQLVNDERAANGLPKLMLDNNLQNLARRHAKDMFKRGYFSHISPDGEDPFMRMTDAEIVYATAGENLALAPTVELAHSGLMNSPGHRANILEERFGHIGIGVIDGGVYGKMFVQEFTN